MYIDDVYIHRNHISIAYIYWGSIYMREREREREGGERERARERERERERARESGRTSKVLPR